MLVGVKTVTDENGTLKFPSWVYPGLDTDVIVSEMRETSRKPDEVYGLVKECVLVEGRWRLVTGNLILGQGTAVHFENDFYLRWLLVHTFRLGG